MKKCHLIIAAALACTLAFSGCKPEDEITNIPTPKPEAQQVVIQNQQNAPQHTVTVHGAGEVTVSADYATIALGVKASDETAEVASQTCAESMQTVLDAAKELGVSAENIKTGAIDITAQVRESDGATIGYLASQTVTLVVDDVQLSNGVLSALVDSSVSDLVSVTYSLRDASGAYLSALAVAMQDAEARALAIAEAAGVRLGMVTGVSEDADAAEDLIDKAYDKSEIAVPAGVTVSYSIP